MTVFKKPDCKTVNIFENLKHTLLLLKGTVLYAGQILALKKLVFEKNINFAKKKKNCS